MKGQRRPQEKPAPSIGDINESPVSADILAGQHLQNMKQSAFLAIGYPTTDQSPK